MPSLRARSLPLGAVRAFEAAGRLGSFKAAAAELGVTPAAISHQVKALEVQLGAVLFERLHRELRLTPAGASLASASSAAFRTLDEALDTLASDGLIARATTLTVSAAPTFASKWLAPRLHRFQAEQPRIELRLLSDGALADPALDGRIDVALRYGKGPYASQLDAERLWPSGRIGPVCHPEIASEYPSAASLTKATLLRTALPQGRGEAEPIGWLTWFAASGIADPALPVLVDRAPLFGTTQLAIEAALSGRGIALAPMVLVADDVRRGRLAIPVATFIMDPHAYWLLVRRDRTKQTGPHRFASWIQKEAAAFVDY